MKHTRHPEGLKRFGEHLRTMSTEIEKGQVGQVWAANSGGRAVFAMLFKQEQGMGLSQQIDKALSILDKAFAAVMSEQTANQAS